MAVNIPTRDLTTPLFNLNEHAINHYINYGRFGNFHYSMQKKEYKNYFLKILKKSVILDRKLFDKIYHEIELYEKLGNSIYFPKLQGLSTNDPKYLGLLFDFIPGGKLRTLLKKKKVLTLEQTKFYIANILLLLEYLHKNKIIYRDLKPDNLLFKENGYLTLLDITYAKELKNSNDLTYTLCGTPNYLAPEIILNKGYNYSVDFWSLGIILYEMLVGKDPFYSHDPMLIYQNILTNKLKFPKIIDRDAKTLINYLLVADPHKRYGCLKNGVNDIKNHRLYNDFRWKRLSDFSLEAPFKPDFEEENDVFSKYYDEEKINIKLKEKYEKHKEEAEKTKKEFQENKNAKSKKVNLIEGMEIFDSDTEAREILESEDPFMDW